MLISSIGLLHHQQQTIAHPSELNLLLDFINKLKIVEEELDESLFFMELIVELNPDQKIKTTSQVKEGNELLSIIVKALKTSRINLSKNRNS